MRDAASYARVNNILLGWIERPTLKWLAAHSPAWITPDIYTVIGVLGSVLAFVGYILSHLHPAFFWLATLGFLLNWYGDSLDGTLARYRHIERPVFGFFIDHVLDVVSAAFFFLGLGLSPYISFNVASLALVSYLLISALAFLRTVAVGEFKISYSMLGPTEARALAILLNTAMFFFGVQLWPFQLGGLRTIVVNPYDVSMGAIALILLYFFVSTAWQDAVRLAKAGQ